MGNVLRARLFEMFARVPSSRRSVREVGRPSQIEARQSRFLSSVCNYQTFPEKVLEHTFGVVLLLLARLSRMAIQSWSAFDLCHSFDLRFSMFASKIQPCLLNNHCRDNDYVD